MNLSPLIEANRLIFGVVVSLVAVLSPASVLLYWVIIRRNKLEHERFQAKIEEERKRSEKHTQELQQISEARLEDREWILHELQYHRQALSKLQLQNQRQARRIQMLEGELRKLGAAVPAWQEDLGEGDPHGA